MSNARIGVFDSGVGGLSVMQSIRQLLPAEHLMYCADSAYAPYGSRGDQFVLERSQAIVEFFIQEGVKAIVVACNTATAASIAALRTVYTCPLIGIEPAIKPAARLTITGKVGVLATQGTLNSTKFAALQAQQETDISYYSVACHGLVEAIEQGEINTQAFTDLLKSYVDPLLKKGVDTLVLGCTHYSLIKPQIAACAAAWSDSVVKPKRDVNMYSEAVKIVDFGNAIAIELQRRLQTEGLLNEELNSATVKFFSSAPVPETLAILQSYWPEPINELDLLVKRKKYSL